LLLVNEKWLFVKKTTQITSKSYKKNTFAAKAHLENTKSTLYVKH